LPTEPDLIKLARKHFDPKGIEQEIKDAISVRFPVLRTYLRDTEFKVFGIESGFFHMAAAQGIDWGLPIDAWLHDFTVAIALGAIHFSTQDNMIDARAVYPENIFLSEVTQSLHLRAVSLLCPNLSITGHLDRYFARYAAAILMERRHVAHVIPYSASEIFQSGEKSAPGNITFPLLIERSGRPWSLLSSLELSACLLSAGLQLHDDIADLADDLGTGYVSNPAATTLLDHMGVPEGPLPGDVNPIEVEARMYLHGVASTTLAVARHAFERSAAFARDATAGVMAEYAEYCRARTDLRLGRISETRKLVAREHAQ
jgi:hypothetical protein